MLKLFTPNYYIHRFNVLTSTYLKEKGIKLLICDIDNTLVAHDEASPSKEAKDFIEGLVKDGIEVVFISNNKEERVAYFANQFPLPYYAFATKPLSRTYRKALKDYPYKRDEIAILGDQLMTDILGGNWMKFYTILTAPAVERDLSFTKFNRIFERMVFYLLKKTKRLVKGEFDA